jgi:hypothetical protein
MDESVRWTVKVSKETDVALRTYLAQTGSRKGDLSKFIEEAVRWRVLDRTTSGIRARIGGTSPEALQALIDDAVAHVRAERTPGRTAGGVARSRKPARPARRARR